jgi:hypothetical protein
MLVFAGMDADDTAKRAAKLKALQEHYRESIPTDLQMLAPTALGKENAYRGTKLVINAPGSMETFAGRDVMSFFNELASKGFQNGAFQSLYLIACDNGRQDRDEAIVSHFAHDLKLLFKQNQLDIALYAPRGRVRYSLQTISQNGENTCQVTAIVVHSAERDYPLSEGMLRVMA